MEQLEQEVIEWHTATFPQATLESQILKWQEEFRELKQANNYRSYLLELCDCIIVATAFKRYGEAGEVLSKTFNDCLLTILNNKKENWEFNSEILNRFIKAKLEINKNLKSWEFVDRVYKHLEVDDDRKYKQ